jgi:hypothetical protein
MTKVAISGEYTLYGGLLGCIYTQDFRYSIRYSWSAKKERFSPGYFEKNLRFRRD